MPDAIVTIAAPGCGCEIAVTVTTATSTDGRVRVAAFTTPRFCPSCDHPFDPVSRFILDCRAEAQWLADGKYRRTIP